LCSKGRNHESECPALRVVASGEHERLFIAIPRGGQRLFYEFRVNALATCGSQLLAGAWGEISYFTDVGLEWSHVDLGVADTFEYYTEKEMKKNDRLEYQCTNNHINRQGSILD
jgi:hypothetical protein